jgi:hypothetical protein
MGYLGLGEPGLGFFIILFGAILNREQTFNPPLRSWLRWRIGIDELQSEKDHTHESLLDIPAEPTTVPSPWRRRDLHLLNLHTTIPSPNTKPLQTTLPSRILHKFPYIIEIIYWALIYSVYQMGRAFIAVRLSIRTAYVARAHALQIIRLEKHLGLFIEQPIQAWFLQFPSAIALLNKIYSFIHLPATISFLVLLYWFCITRHRQRPLQSSSSHSHLYETRRRTLAVCNLLAFLIFSTWPCMPPRLMDDTKLQENPIPDDKPFGFIDTVHAYKTTISAFNNERFTNQFAAMPSMHFGYSLLIGITIATLPLSTHTSSRGRLRLPSPVSLIHRRTKTLRIPRLSWQRSLCITAGISYPLTILTAIIATANHFVLDAVAGAIVVGIAWRFNGIMLNLRVVEDYVLWLLRIHKPVPAEDMREEQVDHEIDGGRLSRQSSRNMVLLTR